MSEDNGIMQGMKEAGIFAMFKDVSIDRIIELASAERDGRVVVLPVAVDEIASMDKDNLLMLAIELYGKDAQMLMMIEEASELTKAICKVFRASDKDIGAANDHVLEEIADCKIMIRQMELIFGDPSGWESLKLHRLEERINSHVSKQGNYHE